MALNPTAKYRIPGYSKNAIDIHGNVYSNRTGKWKKLTPCLQAGNSSNRVVGVYHDEKGKRITTVLSLMKLAFFPNLPKNKIVVRKANFPDDSIGNLQVISIREYNLKRSKTKRKRVGLYENGRLVEIYPSLIDCSRKTGIPLSTANSWVAGRHKSRGSRTLKYISNDF